MELHIKALDQRIGDTIPAPRYATPGAAAMDLCACIDEPVFIAAHQRAVVPTGIAISLDAGHVALLFARSGLGIKQGICLANGVGVIDSDYRGEIKVGLANISDVGYTVQPGDRIAQLMIAPVSQAQLLFVEELDETERGAGGLGSTGR